MVVAVAVPVAPPAPRAIARAVPPPVVAWWIGCSTQSLNRMVAAGKFPQPFRVGGGRGRRRWLESTVLDWLESSRLEQTQK
jgi:predicted DNA-binding transcriptional regulator AlpA